MKMRSLMMVTALLGTMVLTDTGCRTKAGGWRWPWQKDTTALSNGVELENSDIDTDLPTVTDEAGTPVSGARFEDSLQKVQGLHLEPVYFGFDSYSVPPSELPKIQAVATYLQENAQHVLVVEGHCDERGSNEYNLSLGENRAQTVRTALVNLGIAADRIQTRSFGEEKPAVQGSGEEVWRLNRRGEFSVYQQ